MYPCVHSVLDRQYIQKAIKTILIHKAVSPLWVLEDKQRRPRNWSIQPRFNQSRMAMVPMMICVFLKASLCQSFFLYSTEYYQLKKHSGCWNVCFHVKKCHYICYKAMDNDMCCSSFTFKYVSKKNKSPSVG